MTKQQARGLRNFNPGNIRLSKDPWQGLASVQADPAFFQFKSAEWGIRALARTLITYHDKRLADDGSKIDTIAEVVDRWAPPSENNTGAYVRAVAAAMGRGPNDPVDLHRFEDLAPLVKAIIKHENGQQPYSEDVITKGLELAGVTKKPGPAAKSGIVIGSTTAAVAAPLSQVADTIQQTQAAITPLADTLEIARWVLLGLAVAGAGVALYAKLRDIRQQQAVAS